MKTLSIIGCGKVGTTVGVLFERHKVFDVIQIVTRSEASLKKVTQKFKAAAAYTDVGNLLPADLFMITTPDDEITGVVGELRRNSLIKSDTIVFHCSGALSSSILHPTDLKVGHFASVHPVKSFISDEPESFSGTYCGIEGDAQAVKLLAAGFEQIGGKIFQLDSEKKLIYHAGTVFVCNYLTTLFELGIRCFSAAGIKEDSTIEILAPIIEETIRNILKHGVTSSLSGPIARGDADLVSKEISAVTTWDKDTGELYRRLGRIALTIAENKGELAGEKLLQLKAALS